MQAIKKSLIISTALLVTTAIQANTALQDSSANETVQQELSYEDQMLTKLFLNHVRDRNYEWALSIWEEISQKDTEELQTAYLKALEGNGQTEGLLAKHQELLQEYPNNRSSRFYMAKHHFARAETQYQREMAKYQQNENATTYAYLRRELSRLSEDYRKSRDILLKLLEEDPGQRAYLLLLRNCYMRLSNEVEVAKINQQLEAME